MKIVDWKDEPELLLQKIEDLLNENNAQLYVDNEGELVLDIDSIKYKIYNIALERYQSGISRAFDDDKLVEIE